MRVYTHWPQLNEKCDKASVDDVEHLEYGTFLIRIQTDTVGWESI